jgi:hypothetical protein
VREEPSRGAAVYVTRGRVAPRGVVGDYTVRLQPELEIPRTFPEAGDFFWRRRTRQTGKDFDTHALPL